MSEMTEQGIDISQNTIQNTLFYHITYPAPSEAQRNRNEHIIIEYSNRWRLEYLCSMVIMTIRVYWHYYTWFILLLGLIEFCQ